MDPETSKDGSSPFSRVTFNDHSGQLWILTILSLLYSFLGALTRAYIKYRMFGFDDLLFASATVRRLISPLKSKLTIMLGFTFSSIHRRVCWLKQWPRQIQLYHASRKMGDIFESKPLSADTAFGN
jgi:hypothetical protein